MSNVLRPEFRMPLAVLLFIALGFAGGPASNYLWALAIAIGIGKIVWDSIGKIRRGEISLDYIAFLAMAVAPFADQYLAGAVVALMITGGESLDEYASARAESALRSLVESIPKSCIVRLPSGDTEEKPIQEIRSGEVIVVKPNELVPLDGTLVTTEALLNEANLTGEAIPVTLRKGAFIKSGCVNAGETLELAVEGSFESSTYMRIVHLVDEAKENQAPVVKLAEKVNFPFTAIALVLAGGAYFMTGELARALAVLVIATPCPLIIAAPVAFIGGLSRAARRGVIVKRPTTLEVLSRAHIVFFDKTGTLTLGEPKLVAVERVATERTEEDLLAIVGAIEFHSIHPLARAIVSTRRERGAALLEAKNVTEHVGTGIEGDVAGAHFRISKAPVSHDGITLSVHEGEREIARLHFEDVIKENVHELFESLQARAITMEILTGDKQENADRLFGGFGIPIRAEQSPETKFAAIDGAKKRGMTVVMVGDGLNDAPALAEADVGVVFSGTENSAAIDAADAVILGRDVSLIVELFDTAHRAMRVAAQSIWGGVALSSLGMIFAALGFVPPVAGAVIQEVIDVVVILNSLRAATRP